MTKKNKTFKVGDRVRWMYDDGTWSGDIGTVVSVPDAKYGVDWDVGISAAYEARKLALDTVPAESKVTDRLYEACQAGISAAYEARKLALDTVPAESKVTDRLYKACQALAEEYINNQTVDYAGNGVPGSIVMEIIDALDEAPLRSRP
jgi:hypothetical protein